MKFIAQNPDRENYPDYIDEAIGHGFDAEVDIWIVNNQYFLGHETPQYPIDLKWLNERCNNLWCHAKNLEGLHNLIHGNLNVFWHQNDDYTLTTHNFIWTYPNREIREFSYRQIILLFDWTNDNIKIPHGGICSDEIILYKNKYNTNQ